MQFDKETRESLCIAYAQARLTRKNEDVYAPPSSEEFYAFLRDYAEAQNVFEQAVKELPF